MTYLGPKSYGLEIAKGNVSGTASIHKFGNSPDFDTGDGEITVWDGADDGSTNAMVYTYSSTADIGLMSSSAAGDTQTVEVQGTLSDGTLSVQTFTLNGTTDVDLSATGTDFKRVFRLKNTGATTFAGDVYLRTNGSAQASGIPSTANTVRLKCRAGLNQTTMAIYTIPLGKTGYLCQFWGATAGANKTANYISRLKARPTGGVFQLKHETAAADDGTSHYAHRFDVPESFAALTDLEMTVEIATTSITSASFSAGFEIILVDD